MSINYNNCCHQSASNPPIEWAKMCRGSYSRRLYATLYHQLSPESATVTVSVESQFLFWGPASIYPVCNCLFPRHSPFLTLCHCRVHLQPENRNAIPVTPNKGGQTAEQSPFKILQCASMLWLSVKTLRVNLTVFNSMLKQKQTRFYSNGRVSNTKFLRYTQTPYLSLPLPHFVPGFTCLDQGHQNRLPKSQVESFQV